MSENYKKSNAFANKTSRPERLWATDRDPTQHTSRMTYSKPLNEVWLRSNSICHLGGENYKKIDILALETSQPERLCATDRHIKQYESSMTYS